MNLIDRYLLREWLKILALLLGATMGLLFMQALYNDFRDLIDLGAGVGDVVRYFAVSMPSYLSIVLPLSLLLSLLFVLSKMHRNNEIIAICGAGLNIFSTTRVLWLASVVCCGVSLLLNARVVPWSVEQSRRLYDGLQLRKEMQQAGSAGAGLVYSVTFDNVRQGHIWFINRYSRPLGRAYGATVSELDPRRREKTRLLAREARFDAARRAWIFTDGRELWFDPETGDLLRSVPFAEKTISRYTEDPELMLLIDRRPVDLSFFELRRIVDYFTVADYPRVTRYAVRYYGLLADTLGPLIIMAIAIPFSVSGVRVSPAVGVSKSIGLFFVYYVLLSLANVLGGEGMIEPLWAACAPNLAMIGIATWLFGRMR
ncbi:MAG: LptF/LptG family permease [Opitutaceae bacterium]|nr:LptF/LptG family permease [Opitutaceae bacterium]